MSGLVRTNAYVDVYRTPMATGGATQPAQKMLTQVPVYLYIYKLDMMAMMQNSAMKVEYHMQTDVDTDVRKLDIIQNITRADNGAAWFTDADQEVWRVIEARNTGPGPLEHRVARITRFVSSGPMPV